ncbi:MAG: hypothetical protein JF598_03920 [Streptomyces sp.]|jgi:hypothetical protein|nr:hypothetical protein [Streptomyces sp.]
MEVVDTPTPDTGARLPWTCPHQPLCPPAEAADHDAASIRVIHPEQGWVLLCNGVIRFDDTGELLPDGRAIPPQRDGSRASA